MNLAEVETHWKSRARSICHPTTYTECVPRYEGKLMVTEEQKYKILELSKLPVRARWIATEVGLSPAQVRSVLKRDLPPNDSTTPFPAELISQVIELTLRKVDIREVAIRVGVKPWKVSQILAEWMPVRKRQLQGRRGVPVTHAIKRALRRDHRQYVRGLSKRTCISERTLRKILAH